MYNLDQTVFVVQNLLHECDGLIFTPIRDPYTSGQCLKLLKWKPVEKNSADFKLQGEMIHGKRQFRLQVVRNRIDANFDWLTLDTPQEEETFGKTGLVVECDRWSYIPFWNGTEWIPSPRYPTSEKGPGWRKGGWKPLRIRSDKLNGNSQRTVENVFHSILDNITVDELDKFIRQGTLLIMVKKAKSTRVEQKVRGKIMKAASYQMVMEWYHS
ncbi:hypothetical protein JH06_2965 [Blastocystis sp. subtype 4]|uniref:hypothetical protein n=1 Tax=Blastocystis sp. subtype 4 TaxID=944170 RepID=UPI00071193D8|nr:hypothetical protein JH06_2965 [Blastocystis sp. subtype 4]KNB43286.1 hypothetical protein JH06_2965 [Blastocystis sp. subtype 4]|eukprot:XP_014526729.1 hypothetical protein JH06_2965 [Blastocystis sp. subtype 4]